MLATLILATRSTAKYPVCDLVVDEAVQSLSPLRRSLTGATQRSWAVLGDGTLATGEIAPVIGLDGR
jgi:hypothetical protein